MPKSGIDSKVSVNAIRRANQRRKGKTYSSETHSGSNGEIYLKFSTGLATRHVTLTRDQVSSAYNRVLSRRGKKI